jgi:hypothetical protein
MHKDKDRVFILAQDAYHAEDRLLYEQFVLPAQARSWCINYERATVHTTIYPSHSRMA